MMTTMGVRTPTHTAAWLTTRTTNGMWLHHPVLSSESLTSATAPTASTSATAPAEFTASTASSFPTRILTLVVQDPQRPGSSETCGAWGSHSAVVTSLGDASGGGARPRIRTVQ